jgi:hypothetical protein
MLKLVVRKETAGLEKVKLLNVYVSKAYHICNFDNQDQEALIVKCFVL